MDKERQILANYIQEKGLRKTPERFAILEKIAEFKGYFTIEELFDHMKEKNFRVSLSTLYNTVSLFMECGLVERHTFDNKVSYYELKFNKEPYNHQICTMCGKVTKQRNKDLALQLKHVGVRGFKVDHYQLNLYGLCKKCQRASKKK